MLFTYGVSFTYGVLFTCDVLFCRNQPSALIAKLTGRKDASTPEGFVKRVSRQCDLFIPYFFLKYRFDSAIRMLYPM